MALSAETMDADAKAALVINRAAGVPIPKGDEFDGAFLVGFAEGARWALDQVKALNAGA